MLGLIKRYSALNFVETLGFCLMGNHFHILVKAIPGYKFSDQDIKKRYVDFYGDDRLFTDGLIPSLRAKLSGLSEFVREIKVGFAIYYNKNEISFENTEKSIAFESLDPANQQPIY